MAESMSYPATSQYLPPPTQYYPTHVSHNMMQVQQQTSRPEVTQRKRPKYTRSKTGCLTCRVKKIKCDETKPSCMRCTHGQRDCTWPEGVPARKKPIVRKDSVDGRPSTAGSSGMSESSTPPTREHSPPRRSSVDLNLLPLPSRRPNDGFLQLQPMSSEQDSGRRSIAPNDRTTAYAHHTSNSTMLSMIPETSYPRYEHPYPNGAHHPSRQTLSPSYRSLGHQPMNQWNPPPEALESYVGDSQYLHGNRHSHLSLKTQYPSIQERTLVAHSSPIDSHNRYQ